MVRLDFESLRERVHLDGSGVRWQRGANVGPCNYEVVEVDDVHLLFGPAVGDVGFHGEGIGPEGGAGAPVDVLPMALQLAIDPKGLFAVRFSGGVVFEHEFTTNPGAAFDFWLFIRSELIPPIFSIATFFHLMPVGVVIPLARWRVTPPVPPGFQ